MRAFRSPFIPAFIVCGLAFGASAAGAKDFTRGAITVVGPWLRATPPRAPVAGGYMTIRNSGAAPDRLTGASVDFAKKGDVHEMTMDKGVMKMRALPNGLEIKPGQSVTLSPSSFHIMFMGLKRQIKEGETIPGAVDFEKAGTIAVQFTVESIGAKTGPDGGKPAMDGHDAMHMH
jgi:copper(I)-binding protein